MWNGQILKSSFLELHSYALNGIIIVKAALHLDSLEDLFHLPLSVHVFDQYCELEIMLQSLHIIEYNDIWTYIWGGSQYSASKAYNHLIGSQVVHPTFKWLWKSSYQQKHKVFYWMFLQNRLNRVLLRRKRMQLESYTCDLCILQKQKTLRHLFFICSFAKKCWQ
jgi:hypothetical protein